MFRSLLVLLGALLIFPSLSIASPEDTETNAVKVAESWLTLVDEGQYPKSWKDTASYFRLMVTEKQWIETADTARKSLGKLISRKISAKKYLTSLQGAPDGEYVVDLYLSGIGSESCRRRR